MALIHRIFGRREKTLSEMSRIELRKQEALLTRQRDKLLDRIEQLARQKQTIFQRGAESKSPELRKALAQDFELRTQEQAQSARELNLRGKELLTVSRIRMVRENNERGLGTGRLNITDRDMAKLGKWINDDAVGQDLYQERLNTLLEMSQAADSANAEGTSQAQQELLHLWSEMDSGGVSKEAAYDQADRALRERMKLE